MTGGGKDLKNPRKSIYCLYDFFKKFTNLYKNLTFVAYDKIGGEGFRAQEGPGASHSWKFFLTTVCRAIKKIISRTKCRPLLLRAANRGAILIEFAVCMPILIILLFYIHDLMKLKRYYMQSEFAGQQMANILQNISKGQRVTLTNMKHAAALAWLSIYPGKTMHSITGTNSRHELSHDAIFVVQYVKGLSGGKASVLWCCSIYSGSSTSPNTIYAGSWQGYANGPWVTVKGGTNVTPSSIYPTLKINEGENKIIVESQIVSDSGRMNPNVYVPTDDRDTRAKKAFGLHLIFPKSFSDESPDQGRYFPSVVIFTPKSGLFSETAPS